MKRFLTLFLAFVATCALAQDFGQYFEDNTLRVDYVFGGDSTRQYIHMQQMYKQSQWAGRRARLSELFLQGNGQIRMFDHASKQLIYVHSFSTLFQEWLNEIEATKLSRSFEGSYNLPFPKAPVDIEITLTDKYNQVTTKLAHYVDPTDILIRRIGDNGIPYKYLVQNGNITDCVDIAIVAEGYQENEMDKFYADAQRAADALLSHEPFNTLRKKFNIVAVGATSKDSGPSIPRKGIWHDTACSSHYDTFYIERYLTTERVHTLFNLLSGVPFEHIIVLINTSVYGGGGIYNQWTCTTTNHPTFKEVLVHEFGHSYAGLADEYEYGESHALYYPKEVEPWEPNITTLKDFNAKWKDMLKPGTPIPTTKSESKTRAANPDRTRYKDCPDLNELTKEVGVYEGAGYQPTGAYRPAKLCRMNVNEVQDFCPVCTRAIVRITEFYTAR